MPHFTFIALFHTPTYDGEEFSLVRKPTKIEFFKVAREIRIIKQLTRVATAPREGELKLMADTVLKTPAGQYHLAISARVTGRTPSGETAAAEADTLLDCTIAKLAATFGDQLFCNQIYRGPVVDGTAVASFHLSVAPGMVDLDAAQTGDAVDAIDRHLGGHPESATRLRLAAKFMSRQVLMDGIEECFLLQWTMLEIHPMRGTTHIQSLRTWIAARTGQSLEQVETKLQIGRLYGHRCELVHNGHYDSGPLGHKIADIVCQLSRESIRDLCGLPYAGNLDRFFA